MEKYQCNNKFFRLGPKIKWAAASLRHMRHPDQYSALDSRDRSEQQSLEYFLNFSKKAVDRGEEIPEPQTEKPVQATELHMSQDDNSPILIPRISTAISRFEQKAIFQVNYIHSNVYGSSSAFVLQILRWAWFLIIVTGSVLAVAAGAQTFLGCANKLKNTGKKNRMQPHCAL